MSQGDVWWIDLPAPAGSEAGYRRPGVVVQSDAITAGGIHSAVVVPLTTNLVWAETPGCLALSAEATGLPRDSVAQAFQIAAYDLDWFIARTGRLSPSAFEAILRAVDDVLGR